MPLEALLIPDNLTDSDSDGIDGGTGCNFIIDSLNIIIIDDYYNKLLQYKAR